MKNQKSKTSDQQRLVKARKALGDLLDEMAGSEIYTEKMAKAVIKLDDALGQSH